VYLILHDPFVETIVWRELNIVSKYSELFYLIKSFMMKIKLRIISVLTASCISLKSFLKISSISSVKCPIASVKSPKELAAAHLTIGVSSQHKVKKSNSSFVLISSLDFQIEIANKGAEEIHYEYKSPLASLSIKSTNCF